GVLNVYRGGERRTNIPTFQRVRYRGLYPGVDAVFHGDRSQLEYDFVVAANADPSRIALNLRGADSIKTTANGDLLIHVGNAVLRQEAPLAYQDSGGRRVPVNATFRVHGRRVSFDLGDYDRAKALVID